MIQKPGGTENKESNTKEDLIHHSRQEIIKQQKAEIQDLENKVLEINSFLLRENPSGLTPRDEEELSQLKKEFSFCSPGSMIRHQTLQTEEGSRRDVDFRDEDFNVMKLKNNLSQYQPDHRKGIETRRRLKDELNDISEMNSVVFNIIQSMEELNEVKDRGRLEELRRQNSILIK